MIHAQERWHSKWREPVYIPSKCMWVISPDWGDELKDESSHFKGEGHAKGVP